MIIVVTDNLDEHTIFVSYSFYVGEGLFDKIQIMNRMYCTKNLKNLLFDIKLIAISTKKSPFPYSESRGNTKPLAKSPTEHLLITMEQAVSRARWLEVGFMNREI